MSFSGKQAIRRLFEDPMSGRLVLGQTPNTLAFLVVAAHASRLVTRRATPAETLARGIGTASLSLWALDEMLRGVNPFRRIGGAAVLIAIALPRRATSGSREERRRRRWAEARFPMR